MTKERIMHILKHGQQKGFRMSHIRSALLEKGYDRALVDQCISELQEGPQQKEPINISTSQRHSGGIINYLYVIIIILILSLGISLFIKPDIIEQQIIIEKNCSCEDLQYIQDDTPLKEKLDKYNELSLLIDGKQKRIDEQINLIDNLNTSLEHKEEVIESQILELKTLNAYLKKERKDVVALLLEVVNYIIKS